MKTIILLANVVIGGAVRQPSEGPITVRNDAEADALIENGSAELFEDDADTEDEGDGLNDLTVAALKDLATNEQIDLGENTKKADIITAIRAHRDAA